MKKSKSFVKTILSVVVIVLISFESTNLYACTIIPGEKKGWCEKTVEGGTACVSAFFKDCTSSGGGSPITEG